MTEQTPLTDWQAYEDTLTDLHHAGLIDADEDES